MSEFTAWAEEEVRRAGLFDKDSDYGGMLGDAVMKLVHAHNGQGHSGFSSALTVHIFTQLADRRALTPISSDPAEWIDRTVQSGAPLWQNRRDSKCFSEDGGKTWWSLDDSRWQRFKRKWGRS